MTDEHPFYRTASAVGGLGDALGWTPARTLAAGDEVLGDSGVLTVIANAGEAHPQGVKVYNLEVEQAHTYFVLAEHAPADADAVWVHNAKQADYLKAGTGRRIEEVIFRIDASDLNTGTSTNAASRKLAKLLGYSTDDAGHVRGKQLGGKGGKKSDNIFPQDPATNRGNFQVWEGGVAELVETNGGATAYVRFLYDDAATTRPWAVEYLVESGGKLHYSEFYNP